MYKPPEQNILVKNFRNWVLSLTIRTGLLKIDLEKLSQKDISSLLGSLDKLQLTPKQIIDGKKSINQYLTSKYAKSIKK